MNLYCVRAAELGNAQAQYELGRLYDNGKEVLQDEEAALKLYTAAAEQGHVEAHYSLGWMLIEEGGVLQDNEAALKWWTRAAELGDTRTPYLLGCMYALGEAVPQNNVLAFMWFSIATRGTVMKNQSMYNRDTVAKKMTPAQIKEAKSLATKWMKKYRSVK